MSMIQSNNFDYDKFQGIANIAAVSLAVGYPTTASVPHSVVNGFKNVASVCLEADIDIPQIAAVSTCYNRVKWNDCFISSVI